MGSALPDNDALNRRAANLAGLPGALVNLEMVLKVSTAVNPIDACTMMLDALLQNLADAG